MPATSEKQRKLFRAALAMKRGAPKKGKAGEIASKVSEKSIKDFVKKEDSPNAIAELISDDIELSNGMNTELVVDPQEFNMDNDQEGTLTGIDNDMGQQDGMGQQDCSEISSEKLHREISYYDGNGAEKKITIDVDGDIPSELAPIISSYLDQITAELENCEQPEQDQAQVQQVPQISEIGPEEISQDM